MLYKNFLRIKFSINIFHIIPIFRIQILFRSPSNFLESLSILCSRPLKHVVQLWPSRTSPPATIFMATIYFHRTTCHLGWCRCIKFCYGGQKRRSNVPISIKLQSLRLLKETVPWDLNLWFFHQTTSPDYMFTYIRIFLEIFSFFGSSDNAKDLIRRRPGRN